MKRALATVVFALIAGALALPFGDGRYASSPSRPEFVPGQGDYPARSPIAARHGTGVQKVACLTPDLREPRRRIG